MLKLSPTVYEAIKAHGAASYPDEGCGLLLGETTGAHRLAVAIFPVPNTWPEEAEKPRRFLISGVDMLRAEMAAIDQGLDVIGVFHSHPDCPPVASPRDLAWAAWSGYSYLITQVDAGTPTLSRSWQLLPDRSGFTEEEIVLQQGSTTINDNIFSEAVTQGHPS